MLPYLIAGAIGFGIGKLFENGGEAGEKYVNGGGVGKYKMYKLRAEGLNDFLNFLGTGVYFNVKSFTVEPIGVPDVVVSFETNLSLSEIKAKLREVQDSHVMLETIKPIKEYTGERYAGGGSTDDDDDSGEIQEQLDELVQDFSSDEYKAFCYEHDIDEEDGQEMSDFIYSQTNNRCKEIIQEIEDGYYAGGYDEDEDEYAVGGVAKKRRRSASAQYGRSDTAVDKTRVGKPVGYRFSNAKANQLRKDPYAKPTEAQVKKYLGKGIYKENRKNRSDRDKNVKL